MRVNDTIQLSIEAPSPTLRLIRVSGRLDRVAATGVLRLVDAQLDLLTSGHCVTAFVVVDLEAVSSFERGGLEALRHAPYSADRRGVRVYLCGCAGRLDQLPVRVRQLLADFRTFPTAEMGVWALTGCVLNPVDRLQGLTVDHGAAGLAEPHGSYNAAEMASGPVSESARPEAGHR